MIICKPKAQAKKRRPRKTMKKELPGYVLQNTLAIEALRKALNALATTLATYLVWEHQASDHPLSTDNINALLRQIDEARRGL